MNGKTPEQVAERKKQAIQKLNETPTRILAGFQQIRLLVVVTAACFKDDRDLMLRLKFKVEEMREAFLNCAEKCNSLLKEIEGYGSNSKHTGSDGGGEEPEPPKAA